jgi:hexosaminidase
MTDDLVLLPRPRALTRTGATYTLPDSGTIQLALPRPGDALFTAKRLQSALQFYAGAQFAIAGGDLDGAVRLAINPAARPQGYSLTISAEGIQIVGGDLAGLYYGAVTLAQLLRTGGKTLPTLVIVDYPDFLRRGVMLDVSRDRVPKMDTVMQIIDLLSSWKINEFQLYIEHTFAYREHEIVWRKASPFTAEEMLALDAYCRERYIDFVPNQNSFGHWHRWFEHPEYLYLAETETGVSTPWGTKQDHPFSLSPAVPEALPFLGRLYDEFLPNFSSPFFNVGCDETFDLGIGRSKALVEAKGKGRVYLDFLLGIYQMVKARGKTMQFWGDIINEHPELVPELPNDVIALEWGYESWWDFDSHGARFAQSGVPFYTCPGTSSWVTIAGRTDNMLGNIRSAVVNGKKHGAVGILNTAWGDYGHWQQMPADYPGFAYGAASSWCAETNLEIDLTAALDAHAFFDRAGIMGKLALALGNAYKQTGVMMMNSSLLFWLYPTPLAELRAAGKRWLDESSKQTIDSDPALTDRLKATVSYIDATMRDLESAQMQRPDAPLIEREYALMARMLAHGAQRGLLQLGQASASKAELAAELAEIEAEFRALWLERSRPGGLDDSAGRLHKAAALYADG